MKRVLVPYDFSPNSRRACALAMQGFPFGMETEIELLHVVDEDLYASVLARKFVPSDDAIESHLGDELTRIRAELAVAHSDHDEQPTLLDPKPVVARGRPYAVIDQHMSEPEVIGVLLGGQGHGGAGERVLGRTAQRVIRHAEIPVYVVKSPRSLAQPTRLLCGVDWSENSKRALGFAARLCAELEGLLSVDHVIDSPYLPYVNAFAHERDARDALERIRDEQRERLASFVADALTGLELSESLTESIEFGDPADTLASHAQTLLADLLIVGAHGASNQSRYLMGSTAEKLVTAARCDILVIP